MNGIQPARILVVDDDVGTIRVLSVMLRDFGEIVFAQSGVDALAMVADAAPDLVLLDASMPDMDGFDVCATLKADPRHADLPILFITAHDRVETEARALETGAVDFITKPLHPTIVRARVRTHLTLKQRTDELRRLAAVDGLTGLANRRAFDEGLTVEVRRSCRSKAPLSLLLIDVDCFKGYNDRYGHQRGDDCLRAVSGVLSGATRRIGDLAARYGGEEFAAILPACDRGDAAVLAERIRSAVAALAITHEASIAGTTVTVSVGVASLTCGCFDHDASNGDEPDGSVFPGPAHPWRQAMAGLVADADAALYEAKRGGRNRVVVHAPTPL